MTRIQHLREASDHGFARAIEAQFAGSFDGFEECDLLWEARLEEHWIGAYESSDEEDDELDLVRIFGRCEGGWFVAAMIVDGEGHAHGVANTRTFGLQGAALAAFTGG